MNCSKCDIGVIHKSTYIQDHIPFYLYLCNKCSHGWLEGRPYVPLQVSNIVFDEDGTATTSNREHKLSEMVAEVITDLIEAGIDEDAHFRNRFVSQDALKASDIRKLVQDIDGVDSMMTIVRDNIISLLNKVADDFENNGLK